MNLPPVRSRWAMAIVAVIIVLAVAFLVFLKLPKEDVSENVRAARASDIAKPLGKDGYKALTDNTGTFVPEEVLVSFRCTGGSCKNTRLSEFVWVDAKTLNTVVELQGISGEHTVRCQVPESKRNIGQLSQATRRALLAAPTKITVPENVWPSERFTATYDGADWNCELLM